MGDTEEARTSSDSYYVNDLRQTTLSLPTLRARLEDAVRATMVNSGAITVKGSFTCPVEFQGDLASVAGQRRDAIARRITGFHARQRHAMVLRRQRFDELLAVAQLDGALRRP